MSTGKSSSAQKPPRIKGLVKRCRSFKEDFMSRLARNRSLGKDEAGIYSRGRSKRGQIHSEGTSPVPPGSTNSSMRRNDTHDHGSSQATILHKLKEAYLTLSFVESLIHKNCVDLLGGSSNVMLDLMGNLLAEIKKTSVSDSASYQSALSLVKSTVTDFLTAVDVLLFLKDKYDSAQQKVYFEKVLETLNHTRDAITKLKGLVESKENGHAHAVGSVTVCGGYAGSTPALLTSTPTSSTSGGPTLCPKLPHSPGSRSTGGESTSQSHDTGFSMSSEDRRPPLPPKLKQWTTKSFDNCLGSPPTTSPVHHHHHHHHSERRAHHRQGYGHHELFTSTAENSASLLNQWLEESSLSMGTSLTSSSSTSNHRRQSGTTTTHSSSSSTQNPNTMSGQDTVDSFGCTNNWTDSAIFLSNSNRNSGSITSCKVQANLVAPPPHDSCSQYSEPSGSGNHLGVSGGSRKLRTLSDSFYALANSKSDGDSDSDSDDDDGAGGARVSLGNLHLMQDTRSHHTSHSHCSQSLSIDSSLDNLLLADSNSVRSTGMSPNSQRISCSSNTTNTHSPLLLAGSKSNSGFFDPDADGDVFLNEAENRERLVVLQQSQQQDEDDEVPPELPKKTRQAAVRHFILGAQQAQARFNGGAGMARCPSPYDNVDGETFESLDPTTNVHGHHSQCHSSQQYQQQQFTAAAASAASRQFMSYSESRHTLVGASGAIGHSGSSSDTPYEDRPPLPPKKKHSITAYVELMHSFDAQNYHVVPHTHSQSLAYHVHNHKPLTSVHSAGPCPASYQYQRYASFSSTGFGPTSEEEPTAPPEPITSSYSPTQYPYHQIINPTNASSFESDTSASLSHSQSQSQSRCSNHNLSGPSPSPAAAGAVAGDADAKPPVLPPKKSKQAASQVLMKQRQVDGTPTPEPKTPPPPPRGDSRNVPRQLELHYDQSLLAPELAAAQNEVVSPTGTGGGRSSILSNPSLGAAAHSGGSLIASPLHSDTMENLAIIPHDEEFPRVDETLYLLDVSGSLVKTDLAPQVVKGTTTEGPEVKGADPLTLLIYAASPFLDDVKFREVFLLTYRTFLPPLDAINLLWRRFQYFEKRISDRTYVLHCRATLDLFVDVINSLTPMDMEETVVPRIRECIYYLINSGELTSALKARRGLITKFEVRHKLLSPKPAPVTLAVTTEPHTLLHWSATSTAQQMTLLDSELFRHLEPAELLLWAREQSEDFCPALNNFTDHFNKVSYWARSRVLLCSSSRERNRTMKKLIEVMRKLREYNNFNSLLAVLAALDSAPIRRLGFSKRLTEALKPHAALTDSSGSFRTYRQALSESKPPCIPYIGLVLQDLTFVHIGNADFLPDGKVNWIKRWQQWIVLEPIRRFHACQYGFTRNDALLAFLNNFDESLNDDDLWQLSEAIKPRGKN